MAVIINTESAGVFSINGTNYNKIYQPLAVGTNEVAIYNTYDTSFQLLASTPYTQFTIDGSTYASRDLVVAALLPVIYTIPEGGGGGGGEWGTITGTLSNQTDLQAALNAKADIGLTVSWAEITGKPTTVAGFGITDVYTTSSVNSLITSAEDRANHTGTQAISTVTGLQTALDGKVNTTLSISAGTGITGGGALSTDRTLSLDLTYTDGRYTQKAAAETISSTWTYTGRPAFNGGTSGVSSPFTVDSTFVVGNLNADLVDGLQASQFVRSDTTDTVAGVLTFTARPAFNGGTSGVSSPFTVDSTQIVTNLNADLVDGLQASQFLRSDASDSTTGALTAASFITSNWTIDQIGNDLVFTYSGNAVFKISSTGTITAEGDGLFYQTV